MEKNLESQQDVGRIGVAICVEPKRLEEVLWSKLVSLKSEKFFFIKERSEAQIVVSNIESVMFEVLENDEQEYMSVSSLKGDEVRILNLLTRRFQVT